MIICRFFLSSFFFKGGERKDKVRQRQWKSKIGGIWEFTQEIYIHRGI